MNWSTVTMHIGRESGGELKVVTDSHNQTRVSLSTAILAIPNLNAFPLAGVMEQTMIAVDPDQLTWGAPRSELRMTRSGDSNYAVRITWLNLYKTEAGFRMCEREWKGTATPKQASVK